MKLDINDKYSVVLITQLHIFISNATEHILMKNCNSTIEGSFLVVTLRNQQIVSVNFELIPKLSVRVIYCTTCSIRYRYVYVSERLT